MSRRVPSFAAILATVVACSVHHESARAPTLDGVYRLEPADASATIRQIELRAARYWLTPNGCADETCIEHGTFSVEDDRLDLVVDGTGKAYALAFAITATEPLTHASTSPTALRANAESLVGPPADLATQSDVLASSIELVGRQYALVQEDDDCGHRDYETIAQAMCADSLPTKNPVAHCIQLRDTSNCVQGSGNGFSCLRDEPGNNAYTRMVGYQNQCNQGMGGTLFDAVSLTNYGTVAYVMTVCCMPYSCEGGVTCGGAAVTGKPNQTVCGQDRQKWTCSKPEESGGGGVWKPVGGNCLCP